MSKKQQIDKNLKLSGELAQFLVENPYLFDKLPKNASFVVFSSKDNKLNKVNEKLLESLLDEGKEVVKVEETNDNNNPWKFTPITA